MSGGARDALGRWGEDQVALRLEAAGYTILARRYRTRYGEIDLIAENGTFLAFVEVKLRRRGGMVSGREAVDARKQERLRRTAQLYLSEHETARQPRFDVAEVTGPDAGGAAEICYMENAF